MVSACVLVSCCEYWLFVVLDPCMYRLHAGVPKESSRGDIRIHTPGELLVRWSHVLFFYLRLVYVLTHVHMHRMVDF